MTDLGAGGVDTSIVDRPSETEDEYRKCKADWIELGHVPVRGISVGLCGLERELRHTTAQWPTVYKGRSRRLEMGNTPRKT